MRPTLKAPGSERLKLKCDILFSTSAFKFKLRRYNKDVGGGSPGATGQGLTLVHFSSQPERFLTQKYALHTPEDPLIRPNTPYTPPSDHS
jgi:hypothetical protein